MLWFFLTAGDWDLKSSEVWRWGCQSLKGSHCFHFQLSSSHRTRVHSNLSKRRELHTQRHCSTSQHTWTLRNCTPFTNCSHKTGPVQFVSRLPAVSLNIAVFLFSDDARSAVTCQWCFTCCQNTVRFSLCLFTALGPTAEMTLSPLYTKLGASI
jgi:hypothetical protein